MERLIAGVMLVLCTCVAACAWGQAADVTRATLDNGLRVVIVRDTLAPVVTTNMSYLVGSDEASAAFPGMAHAMEHMMFRGSPGLTRSQLLTIAAGIGGAFNAQTSRGVTQYFFTVPSADLDVALHIAAIRMRGVDLSVKGWDKERGAIEQEVAGDMSSPSYKYHVELYRQMFAGTPYAHTPLGTRHSFDKLTVAALREFHDAWYVPNNAILVIAGDVDPTSTLKRVKALFGSIPRKALPARPGFHFGKVTAKTIKEPTDYSNPMVVLAWRTPGTFSKDLATELVLGSALASSRGKLHALGLTGKALGAGFGTSVFQHAGMAYAYASYPRGGDAKQMLKTVRDIIRHVVADGVPVDLIKAAQRRALASAAYKNSSISGLAGSWVSALAFRHDRSPAELRAAVAAVTPADVNALARRIFDPAQADIVILTPRDSGKPVSHKHVGGAEKFAARPTKPATLPDWAKADLARLTPPHSVLDPVSFTLGNGLRVIVQRETVSPVVAVAGVIRSNSDMQAPKHKKGVASLLGAMFNFGTADMSRLQFQKALDKISAYERAGTNFGLVSTSKHFAEGMQLLADQELHPAFRPTAFARMQRHYAKSQAGYLKTPGWYETIDYDRAVFPAGSPQLRYATPKSIGGVTLDDIKAYYHAVYRPDMTTIVVVGDVTLAEVRKVIEADFGAWQAQGPKPVVDYPGVPLNKAGRFRVPDTSAVHDSVGLGELTTLTKHNPDRYVLELGNRILGQGMRSRLMQDLRVKGGLVYGVSSTYGASTHYGSFSVSYACDPDKVAQARAIVIRDIRQMQAEPVSASELHRAKGQLLRGLVLGQSSYGSIAASLLGLAANGYPLNSFDIAVHAFLNTTPGQIQAAFKKYVRPDDFVTEIRGPASKPPQ